MNDSVLHRQVSGALKSCIHSHGPIHKKWVSSAAKRVMGHLKKFNKSFPDEKIKERLLTLMAEEHRVLELLRVKLDKAQDPHKKSHIAGKVSEKRRSLIRLENLLKTGPDAKPIGEKQGDQ